MTRPKEIPRGAATICCLKQGEKYGPEYVNILESMVRRNVWQEPYDFVCFTDDPFGVNPWIRTAPLPYNAPGWWGKMGLYQETVPGIRTDRLLFLDLDVVITGRLDEILTWPSAHAMIRDYPERTMRDARDRHGNTSVILLHVGSRAHIWDMYAAYGKPVTGFQSDQGFINDRFGGSFDLFPDRLMQSYKMHHLQDRVPEDCRIVMFHGTPNPPDCGGWVKDHWK